MKKLLKNIKIRALRIAEETLVIASSALVLAGIIINDGAKALEERVEEVRRGR